MHQVNASGPVAKPGHFALAAPALLLTLARPADAQITEDLRLIRAEGHLVQAARAALDGCPALRLVESPKLLNVRGHEPVAPRTTDLADGGPCKEMIEPCTL